MIDYFYPELGNNSKKDKKFVNELLNPEKVNEEAVKKSNLKKSQNDIVNKNEGKLLTNDGREMLNEKK